MGGCSGPTQVCTARTHGTERWTTCGGKTLQGGVCSSTPHYGREKAMYTKVPNRSGTVCGTQTRYRKRERAKSKEERPRKTTAVLRREISGAFLFGCFERTAISSLGQKVNHNKTCAGLLGKPLRVWCTERQPQASCTSRTETQRGGTPGPRTGVQAQQTGGFPSSCKIRKAEPIANHD